MKIKIFIGANIAVVLWVSYVLMVLSRHNSFIFAMVITPLWLVTISGSYLLASTNATSGGNNFLSLYFKRKKLEQLARIKELEEKTKTPQ